MEGDKEPTEPQRNFKVWKRTLVWSKSYYGIYSGVDKEDALGKGQQGKPVGPEVEEKSEHIWLTEEVE